MRVIFDLDGTLALNEHRQHFVERPVGEKDWDAFFDACDKDAPNWPAIFTLDSLRQAGHTVSIWSGRTGRVYHKTIVWLRNYGLNTVDLKMRNEDDHRPDTVLKKEWLDEATSRGMAPDLIFDDRESVVNMWRENGISCFQVAPGAF